MSHSHALRRSSGASAAHRDLHVVPLDERNRAAVEAKARDNGVLAQHHPVWIDILGGMEEDCRGLVAIEHERVVDWLLFTVSSVASGTVINSMPFTAYGGPAMPRGDTAAVVPLMQALRAEATRLGADVLSVGASPWLTEDMEAAWRQALGTTHELQNFMQLQELGVHPLQQLTRKRRGAIRSEIKRAVHAGLTVVPELTPRQFAEWLTIYKQRYSEIGARPYPDAFHRLAFDIGVPAGMVEFWGVVKDEHLVGGNMFLVAGDRADYFSSAFLTSHRRLYPNSLLLSEVFTAFAQRGIRSFNWQSSPDRGSVYRYKARWGAKEWRHNYMGVLLKPHGRLLQAQISDVKKAFPFRFVLPYSAWPSPTNEE